MTRLSVGINIKRCCIINFQICISRSIEIIDCIPGRHAKYFHGIGFTERCQFGTNGFSKIFIQAAYQDQRFSHCCPDMETVHARSTIIVKIDIFHFQRNGSCIFFNFRKIISEPVFLRSGLPEIKIYSKWPSCAE